MLSGGEKARAMFSRMMVLEPNTMIFDEPTDHLDLEAISSLNEGLIQYKGSLIFTSQDFELVNTVANRVIEVSPKGFLDVPTDYNDYMTNERIALRRADLA